MSFWSFVWDYIHSYFGGPTSWIISIPLVVNICVAFLIYASSIYIHDYLIMILWLIQTHGSWLIFHYNMILISKLKHWSLYSKTCYEKIHAYRCPLYHPTKENSKNKTFDQSWLWSTVDFGQQLTFWSTLTNVNPNHNFKPKPYFHSSLNH